MSPRSTRFAVVSVCVVLAVAGTLAALLLFGGAPTKGVCPSSPGGQEDLETVLARVARPLDPKLRAKLAEAVLTESARGGYDPLFILGLVSVESSFRTHVSSERGAYGLMQLQPSTFAWIAGREPDIGDGAAVSEDPVIDVRLAVRYFHWLEKRFPRRDEALMAYNAVPQDAGLRAGASRGDPGSGRLRAVSLVAAVLLAIAPAPIVEGRVGEPSGAGAAYAQVTLAQGERTQVVRTSADGRFRFRAFE